MAFGRALPKRRTEAGVRQTQLGFEAGLGRVFVSWIEIGHKLRHVDRATNIGPLAIAQ